MTQYTERLEDIITAKIIRDWRIAGAAGCETSVVAVPSEKVTCETLRRFVNGFLFFRMNSLASGLRFSHSSVLNILSMFFSDTPLHDVIFLSLLLVSLVLTLEMVRFPLRCLDVMVFELIAVRKYATHSL